MIKITIEIRGVMLIFFKLIVYSSIVSCDMEKSGGIILPGKIAVEGLRTDDCVVYMNSIDPNTSFKLRNDKEVQYSGLTWLNNEDVFLGNEAIPGISRNDYRGNVVKFDLSGKLMDTIYEAEKGEIAWTLYTSRDDKYLLFTTHRLADPELYPFEGLTPMLSLMIMDLGQKKVIIKIDSIGRSPNFHIEESPWLHGRYQFVYSIYDGTKISSDGKVINPVEEASEGVYIFDMSSGERKLLVPDGYSAIASPTSNQIAYEKDNSIRVLDLNTNEEKIIYEYGSKENVQGTHWTLDGKYIYFAYTYKWGIGDIFSTGEKLVEASTGNEKPFKKIGHGFQSYTWK